MSQRFGGKPSTSHSQAREGSGTTKELLTDIIVVSYIQTVWTTHPERALFPVVENCLIDEQAGFRPEKSCTNQILNLTQYTEDGFENNYPTVMRVCAGQLIEQIMI